MIKRQKGVVGKKKRRSKIRKRENAHGMQV
jgi:hypothetical protein